jgi:hypothetical protein
MKHLALVTLAMLIFGDTLLAQEIPEPHDRTSLPANARFEVVESQITARLMFRLDRFTGHVAQLAYRKPGDTDSPVVWQDMPVDGLKPVDNPTRPRFQIFTSGITARDTFLVDTDNGATWRLTTVHDKTGAGAEIVYDVWELVPSD